MALATFIEVAESIGDTPGGLSPAAMRKRTCTHAETMRNVQAVARLLSAMEAGSARARLELAEAIGQNDLVAFATGVLIDRQIETAYTAIEKQWPKFFTRTTVRNFRPKSIAELHIGAQRFYDIPEFTPYPMAAPGGLSEYFIQAKKTGSSIWVVLRSPDQ
jgi:hypothetical protein